MNDDKLVEAVALAIALVPHGCGNFADFVRSAYAEQGAGFYYGMEDDVMADIKALATAAIAAVRQYEGDDGK